MLGVVIVLAVAGTGMWVFSDDRRWGLVALILLVWGLVIAAFLIARYTRDLRAAESKESGLKTVYELQLEREISARREYELQVERDIRAEVRDEANEELTALKSEVLALRANLEELLGRDLGPSYSELYAAAEQRAIDAQRAKADFVADDQFRAQQDFARVPDQSSEVDDYYGAASVAEEPDVTVPEATVPAGPGAVPATAPAAAPGGPGTAPAGSGQDESPTTVFHVVTDVPPAPAEPAGPDAQPVDVEHVDAAQLDTGADEPFVPMAPQSGYRPPFPPRRYTADAPQQQYSQFQQYSPQQAAPQQAPEDQPRQQYAPGRVEPEAPSQQQQPQAQPDQHEHVAGQHTSGNTVADLIARMNADTERTQGGGRRRKPE
ncbi:membrane protein [Tsukamurella sp. PLM1]|nr:membrane protein [Tsukamurella sp. PLM1]